MTLHVGGWQLLPEILVRLGYSSAGPVAESVRSKLPAPARRLIKAAVRGPLRDRLKSASGTPAHPLESPKTKAAWVRCGANGAIRLNVNGRDPFGSIEPGAEYDAACSELTRELEALTDTDSGERVVTEVVRSDQVFGDRYHPNLPDLIVRYRGEGVITSVSSPRIGTVSEEARDADFARSGEHTSRVRLWHLGPTAPAGETVRGGHVLDVSATVLERLSVPIPDDLDGTPLKLGERLPA
jgi:predicted AlkP superfamily phosphohydrolase/phosphomutase